MRDRFTRVLKGHIALAPARFPKGTTGAQLDALARGARCGRTGLDYDHGTGHGVGCYLVVHEGPQRISKAPNAQPLLPGMIVSNEPGYYKAGAYGIRIENSIVVQPAGRCRRRARDARLRDADPGADRPQPDRRRRCSTATSSPGSTPTTRGCARRSPRWSMPRPAPGWNRRPRRSAEGRKGAAMPEMQTIPPPAATVF